MDGAITPIIPSSHTKLKVKQLMLPRCVVAEGGFADGEVAADKTAVIPVDLQSMA